jgi:hypothetical protein
MYSDVRSLLIDFSYTLIKWIEIHLLKLSHNIAFLIILYINPSSPVFSCSSLTLVMLEGSLDRSPDAFFGSAFCSKVFDTTVMTVLACSGLIPTL